MNNKKKLADLQNQVSTKVKMPRGNQIIGIVEKRLGGSRMHVRTTNSETILARVPGRAKKFLWIREGDIVLLEPWELDKKKADLFYKYRPNEIKILEKKNLISDFAKEEEF